MEFKVRDQVRFKQSLRNCNVVKFGHILSFKGKNNEIAVVSVQDDPRKGLTIAASARREIPVSQLEPVKKLFGGRAIVQANPLYRTIGSLINR